MSRKTAVCAVALVVFSSTAYAQEPEAGAGAGWAVDAHATHTDNATRSDVNRVSDTLVGVGATLALSHQGSRVDSSLNGVADYAHYLDNTYDDDVVAQLVGHLQAGLVPDRLLWTFDDTFGQITIDQFAPSTPDNRQNVNYFTTGPDLIFAPGRSKIRLSGRYSETRYESTDVNEDERHQGAIEWLREPSPDVSLGLVGSYTDVKYTDPNSIIPGYQQEEVFGRLHAKGARQTLNIDVGASRIESGSESFDNPLLRVTWERQVRPSWWFNLQGGSEYRNTADRFKEGINGAPAGPGSVIVSNTPTEAYYGDVSLRLARPRTTFRIGTGYAREDSVEGPTLNQKTRYATVAFGRRLTPRLEALLDYRQEKRDVTGAVPTTDDTRTASARLDWRIGKATYATLSYRRDRRTSDFSDNRYSENMIMLSFGYRQGNLLERGNVSY